MALKSVMIITVAPVPICAYKGLGHAPVIAHPKPKSNPPTTIRKNPRNIIKSQKMYFN